jgi:hypothetical protein
MKFYGLIFLLGCSTLSPITQAQTTGDRISLYFGDWHNATPHVIRGSLEERDILTRGDGLNPPHPGAVFRFINSYVHATLPQGASTEPARLQGQQEIYLLNPEKGP